MVDRYAVLRILALVTSEAVRLERFAEVESMVAELGLDAFLLSGGQVPESTTLAFAALSAYISANDAAALVTAHACCERELASHVSHQPVRERPKGWERWGLGPLVGHCHKLGILDDSLQSQLLEMNEARRVVAHHQDDYLQSKLWVQAVETAEIPHKDAINSAYRLRLRDAARISIECVVRVFAT